MRIQRHSRPFPWVVQRPPDEVFFVIGEEGQNILAITRSLTVPIPRFEPNLPEEDYIEALVKTFEDERGSPPEVLHVFEHEGLLGMCVT